MRWTRTAALGLGVLASLSLPLATLAQRAALPPAAVPRDAPVPFRVGETLTFDVSWSSYLVAGTAVMTLKERRASLNSTAYYIVAEAKPTPLLSKLYTLYYKMETLLDTCTLLPQQGSIFSQEGSRRRLRTTRFDRAANRAFFERQTETTAKSDFAVSPVVQDALAAIYVLRAIPLKTGDRMTMPVSDDGQTYSIRLEVGALERVKVPLGEMMAWKVMPVITNGAGAPDRSGTPVGRNLAVWISGDPRRLPLKFQMELTVGSFVVALREAR